MTEGFSFSGNISEVFGVLRDRELVDRVFVDKEELSNSKGILLICLSFSQSNYHGFGRQRTDSLKGSMTQLIWSFSAFSSLLYMGKTHLYNTNY